MLILEKVSEDKEFRERDRLKLENQQKEAGGMTEHCAVKYDTYENKALLTF